MNLFGSTAIKPTAYRVRKSETIQIFKMKRLRRLFTLNGLLVRSDRETDIRTMTPCNRFDKKMFGAVARTPYLFDKRFLVDLFNVEIFSSLSLVYYKQSCVRRVSFDNSVTDNDRKIIVVVFKRRTTTAVNA